MSLTYLLWGGLLGGLLVVLSRGLWTSLRLLGGLVTGSSLLGLILLSADIEFLGAAHWYNTSPYKEGMIYGLMLLGMGARTLSRAIEERPRRTAVRTLQVDGWDFLLPLLVSFMTFGAVWQQVGTTELSLSSLIIAFQNGFFWQTVMKTRPHPR